MKIKERILVHQRRLADPNINQPKKFQKQKQKTSVKEFRNQRFQGQKNKCSKTQNLKASKSKKKVPTVAENNDLEQCSSTSRHGERRRIKGKEKDGFGKKGKGEKGRSKMR